MVCMGNICRSPMAEVVANHFLLARPNEVFLVKSAGTHAIRSADADLRARKVLQARGYDMPKRKARGVSDGDFERFDLILAMDATTLSELQRRCPVQHQHKLRLFMSLVELGSEVSPPSVPDPYYGNAQGFNNVLDMCEAGVKGLLKFDFNLGDTHRSTMRVGALSVDQIGARGGTRTRKP